MTTDKQTYLGNSQVKRDGVDQEWTKDLILEYQKCMKNPAYFATAYCKVISLDKGLVPFDLYPYQEKMFKSFDEHRFNIVLACRQSGKSISSVAYLLWYALFHTEKTTNNLFVGSTAELQRMLQNDETMSNVVDITPQLKKDDDNN